MYRIDFKKNKFLILNDYSYTLELTPHSYDNVLSDRNEVPFRMLVDRFVRQLNKQQIDSGIKNK
jgi:hypothetical protein